MQRTKERTGAYRRFTRGVGAVLAAVVGAALAVAAPTAAHAAELTADPVQILVGETTTIVATGLGGLDNAFFGLGDTNAGIFTESGEADYSAPVSGGQATATFQAAVAGTVTISVSDGETPLATVELTVGDAPPPGPTVETKLTLTPASATVGDDVTVTVSGLGGLEQVFIGLGEPGAGTFTGGQDQVQVPVTAGSATTTFTPAEEGDIVIAAGDGETVLASATLTVTAAETPTPTVTAVPISAPTDEGLPLVLWIIIIVLAVIIVVGAIVWIVTANRAKARRTAGTPPTAS